MALIGLPPGAIDMNLETGQILWPSQPGEEPIFTDPDPFGFVPQPYYVNNGPTAPAPVPYNSGPWMPTPNVPTPSPSNSIGNLFGLAPGLNDGKGIDFDIFKGMFNNNTDQPVAGEIGSGIGDLFSGIGNIDMNMLLMIMLIGGGGASGMKKLLPLMLLGGMK